MSILTQYILKSAIITKEICTVQDSPTILFLNNGLYEKQSGIWLFSLSFYFTTGGRTKLQTGLLSGPSGAVFPAHEPCVTHTIFRLQILFSF